MKSLYRVAVWVFVAAISLCVLFSETKAAGSQLSNPTQATHMQNVGSAGTNVGHVIDAQADVETLIRDLRASTMEGSSYDSIRIVSQLGKLGAEASPAVEILIDLLGKQLADCDEELRLCPDKTRNCLIERRVCPDGAEMRKYDYLTPYVFAALQQIGAAALPQLSVALADETFSEQNPNRRRLAAGVMGSIGPTAIPFLSEILRAPGYSQKHPLALAALNSVLSKDPPSGNQLASLVPYITPFLKGDFETVDQAINVLGAIGPGAAEAVPSLIPLLSYQRVLADRSCPVGERTGYIFRSGTMNALVKIGTPDAMRAVEQYREDR